MDLIFFLAANDGFLPWLIFYLRFFWIIVNDDEMFEPQFWNGFFFKNYYLQLPNTFQTARKRWLFWSYFLNMWKPSMKNYESYCCLRSFGLIMGLFVFPPSVVHDSLVKFLLEFFSIICVGDSGCNNWEGEIMHFAQSLKLVRSLVKVGLS